MSKYLTFPEIVFTDRRLLLEALYASGFQTIDEGPNLTLFDFTGRPRPETADIVIRREHTGVGASNDIGFKRTATGYIPIVSEYDQQEVLGGKFLVRVRTAYSERVVEEVKRRLHGSSKRTVESGVVKIVVRF